MVIAGVPLLFAGVLETFWFPCILDRNLVGEEGQLFVYKSSRDMGSRQSGRARNVRSAKPRTRSITAQ